MTPRPVKYRFYLDENFPAPAGKFLKSLGHSVIQAFLEIEAKNEKKLQEGLKMLDLVGRDAGHIGTVNIYKKYGIDLHSYKELKF